MNEQFINRNQLEIIKVITSFRELSVLYNQNVSLYLDQDYWEIFDLRICKTIIRHDFKHVNALLLDIQRLIKAILDVSTLKYKSSGKSQTHSLKYLSRFYNSEQIKYFIYGSK